MIEILHYLKDPMGIMVYSLLSVMQDLYHQPYGAYGWSVDVGLEVAGSGALGSKPGASGLFLENLPLFADFYRKTA